MPWAAAIAGGVSLLSGALGTSSSGSGSSSGTSDTAQLTGQQQEFSSKITDLLSSISQKISTQASTTSKATAASGTTQTNQTTGQQQNQNIDETVSSSNDAIDAAKNVISQANFNAANAGKLATDTISDTLRKAAIAFGPTTVQANQTGAYNSTSLSQLRGEAEAAAASDAASTVLNYTAAQQKIASDASANLLQATKTTKGGTTGSTTGTAATGTATAQTGQEIGANVTQNVEESKQASAETKGISDIVNSITGVLTNAQNQQVQQQQSHSGMSVICTELMYQGKMDRSDWVKGMRTFNTYSELSRQGYWTWATPLKEFIEAHPTSRITWLAQHTFCARAKKKLWAKLAVAIPSVVCGSVIGFGWRWDLLFAHFTHRPKRWWKRWTKQECY